MVLHANKFELSSLNRALLWIILLILTVTLLLYPVNFTNEYTSIQAPYIFDNLALFCILFIIWLVVMFSLVFFKPEKDKPSWENILLAAIFGLVFMGFWVVITPYGSYGDGIYNMGHVKYLLDIGHMPSVTSILGYFDYPGMHLVVTTLCQICDVDVFTGRMIFLLVNSVLFSILLYLFFYKILKTNRTAWLGLIMVIMGNVMLVEKMHIFTPGAFGYTLLACFLVTLTISDYRLLGNTISDKIMILIVFIAMAVSYFATSFLIPLVLIGVFIIQLISGRNKTNEMPTTILLTVVIIICWGMYWTRNTFNSLVSFFPFMIESITNGDFLMSLLTIAQSSAGGNLPFWAIITRYFWWGLIILASLLGLVNLTRIKKLTLPEKITTGGLIGCALLAILGLFGTDRGSQFHRYLLYAPIFCFPILISYLTKKYNWKRFGMLFLPIFIIIMSVPTFMSSVNTIDTDAIYTYEITAGEFMNAHSAEQDKDITLFRIGDTTTAWAFYYIPNCSFKGIPQIAYSSQDSSVLWAESSLLLDNYKNSEYMSDKTKLFVISEKSFNVIQHLRGISPNDSRWQEIYSRLDDSSLFYNNGHVSLYY